jgi:outer membrane protein assembly factor BamB
MGGDESVAQRDALKAQNNVAYGEAMGRKKMAEKKEFKARPLCAVCAQSVAVVAAVFALAVGVLLISDHVRLMHMDPLNDPHLLELREQLADSTGDNEALVEQVRTFDFYARRAFFSNQEQRQMGGWLLLGGAVISFLAWQLSKHWNPKLPRVGNAESPDHWELNGLFRQLMAGVGVVLVAVSLFFAFAVQSDLAVVLQKTEGQAETPAPPVEQASPPAQAIDLSQGWPAFRGPGNVGVASGNDVPTEWDVESGEGVLWTAEIPVHGFNSPIIWGNRVFMSGGDEEGLEVFCFDADSGDLVWSKPVTPAAELPEVSEDVGLAAPTMTTDGVRVFVIFASGDLAAFDLDGNPVWQKNLGVPDNPYGMGSSLISDGTRLFVQYDHSEGQRVMALDSATGEQLWETARVHISWATPSLIQTEFGAKLILNDEEFVTAYDPVSGEQLWQVACLGGEVAPSPAFNGKDLLFVANEYAQASALKLTDGEPEMLWQYDDLLPEIASPVASEELVFIPTTAGDIACLDAQTGEVYWEQEFDEGFNASPVLAGNLMVAIDFGGVVTIFEAGKTYHEVARIEMGTEVYATPAILNGRIYIRTDSDLYCIGTK